MKKKVHKANGERNVYYGPGGKVLGNFPTVCGTGARSASKVTDDPAQVTCAVCKRKGDDSDIGQAARKMWS